jgi:hypothetical protein
LNRHFSDEPRNTQNTRKQKLERSVGRGGKNLLLGESADSGNALFFRVVRVFRGLTCFSRAELTAELG